MATVGVGARWLVWYLVTGEEGIELELTDSEVEQVLDYASSVYGLELVEALEAELGAGTVRLAQRYRTARDFGYELEILEAVDRDRLRSSIPTSESVVVGELLFPDETFAFTFGLVEATEVEAGATYSPPPSEPEDDPASSCGTCGPLSTTSSDGSGTGGGGSGGPFAPSEPGGTPGDGETSPDGAGGFLQELGDSFSLEALEGDRYRLSTPWGELEFSRSLLWVLLALLVLLLLISR